VLSALLATTGVGALGDLPAGSYVSAIPTGPAVAAGGPTATARVALAQPAPVEQQPLPEAFRAEVVPEIVPVADTSAEPVSAPLRATLTTPDGPSPALRVHDEIKAQLLTTADAYAYCYYADGSGTISRIFPNRFTPNALVHRGVLELTGTFALVADKPNRTEEVRCLAATSDLGAKLPDVLQTEDLAPLAVPSLDDISRMFRRLSQDLVETRLVVLVLPEQPRRSVSRDVFAALSDGGATEDDRSALFALTVPAIAA